MVLFDRNRSTNSKIKLCEINRREKALLTDKRIDNVLAELEYYDSVRHNSMQMSPVECFAK